jgi:hypothetical protein
MTKLYFKIILNIINNIYKKIINIIILKKRLKKIDYLD